jgi:hypothetical protein
MEQGKGDGTLPWLSAVSHCALVPVDTVPATTCDCGGLEVGAQIILTALSSSQGATMTKTRTEANRVTRLDM